MRLMIAYNGSCSTCFAQQVCRELLIIPVLRTGCAITHFFKQNQTASNTAITTHLIFFHLGACRPPHPHKACAQAVTGLYALLRFPCSIPGYASCSLLSRGAGLHTKHPAAVRYVLHSKHVELLIIPVRRTGCAMMLSIKTG
jgi:hypothetical protein